MLATGQAESPPAPRIDWIFSTALYEEELNNIQPRAGMQLSDPPRIAYVGRLSPEKGVGNLIRAVHCLKLSAFKSLPAITVVGDGPQREELEELSKRLQCQDIVSFVGQLDRPSLSECLNEQDFCVQPSLSEGLSKAWLDAMAHSLPVLSSDVGAAGAVIGRSGERGWLVPPGDVSILSEKLGDVLSQPIDWTSLRTRCRAYVQDRTLEAWSKEIGTRCAATWGVSYLGGKLVRV